MDNSNYKYWVNNRTGDTVMLYNGDKFIGQFEMQVGSELVGDEDQRVCIEVDNETIYLDTIQDYS